MTISLVDLLQMTEHWPLLDRGSVHSCGSGNRPEGRTWGSASWTPPPCSGWTSSQRHVSRSWETKKRNTSVQEKRREEKRRGEKRREEKRLTRIWTLPMSPAAARPHCPPSWCETGSSSSPSLSRGIPLSAVGLCSRLCRPTVQQGGLMLTCVSIFSRQIWFCTLTINQCTCNLSQSSLTPRKSNSSLFSTAERNSIHHSEHFIYLFFSF